MFVFGLVCVCEDGHVMLGHLCVKDWFERDWSMFERENVCVCVCVCVCVRDSSVIQCM